MAFRIFELERWQSDYEHSVEFNLADSSVRGARLGDVLTAEARERYLDLELGYPMVNGTVRLRDLVAALYPGAGRDNVMVTVGGAEANQIVCQALIEPGDVVVVMEPGYRQVWGLAESLGAVVRGFGLDPRNEWRPDLAQLEAAVGRRAKLIYVVNPNNPTGSVLRPSEVERILEIAERAGAWVLADEVYRGAERYTDAETPTLWGRRRYPNVIAVNSLSKAYGLAGLRIGWAVAPAEVIDPLWRRHEYAVISAAAPSMRMAELALAEPMRQRLLDRQRQLSRAGWELMDRWLGANDDLVSVGASEATSMAFVRYELPAGSVLVADQIRQQASVLVAPGEFLGADGHLRITHGLGRETVEPALDRIASVLRTLRTRQLAATT